MSIIDYSWDFAKEEFSLDLDYFNEQEQEDKLWMARTGLDMDSLCGAIETIIFMSDRPVNLMKIKNQIDPDLPLRVIHESLTRLQSEYEQKHHGIRLMEVAQGYQFRTKATYSKLIQKMFKVESLQLSPTAVEVLAIIAYKQPISKAEVESIRGVDSSHIVRALMDRRLVKVAGRSDEMGRPSVYATTPEFLEVFNLNDITELPSEMELEEIANANEVGEIADIKTIVSATDKERFVFDEIEELDELSNAIKEIAADTFFTKSLKDMDKKRVDENGVERKSAFDLLEEYVCRNEIVNQNKTSVESDTITTMMEPRPIPAKDLNELLNVPKESEEEFDIEIDLDDEIEAKLDEVLEQSQDIVDAIIGDPEAAQQMQASGLNIEDDSGDVELLAQTEELPTLPTENEQVEDEKQALADALDSAFDELMGPVFGEEESLEAKEQDIEQTQEDTPLFDTDEIDLSLLETNETEESDIRE